MQLVLSTTYMTLRTTKVTKLSKVYKGKLLIWCWHLMCIYIYIFDQWLAASGSDYRNCIFITIGWFYHKHDMSNCRRNNIKRSIERHFITWHFIIGLAAKKMQKLHIHQYAGDSTTNMTWRTAEEHYKTKYRERQTHYT